MLKCERYFSTKRVHGAPEVCGHCGSSLVTFQCDIRRGYEQWSPIKCNSCGGSTYEVWRGGRFVKKVGVRR